MYVNNNKLIHNSFQHVLKHKTQNRPTLYQWC